MSYFSELGLAEPVLRALGTKGYSDPTPIQKQAIPALLEGRDLLGIAQTGTGKTAAFSLPSIHRLAADPRPRNNAGCRMLVLSPTRELAAQIAENMRGYAKYLALSIQCVFGGVPVGKQARALVHGCDILVATPGRLLDLIDQRALTLRHVEIFVLDEADQMMDLGFIHPLKRIAGMLPKERQSLFFSATMPKAIADLGKQFIHNPVRVEVTPQATTAERVDQYVTFLNQTEKQALLTLRLRAGLADGSVERALVFTRTKHGADRVVRHLVTAGISTAAIHGNKSQAQRTAAIKGFKSGSVPVLVATDIAARGIDIPGVSHVFNFEMPNVAEQYVHRIGRTARAGADGIAMSFVAPDEKSYLRDIERLTRVKLETMPLPEGFTAEAARLPLPSRKAVQDAMADDGRPAHHRPRGNRDGERRGRRPDGRGRPDGREGERPRHAESGDRGPRKPRTDRSFIQPAGGDRPDRARGGDERQGQRGPRPAEARSAPQREHRARDERPRDDRARRDDRPRGDAPGHARAERPTAPRGDRPHRADHDGKRPSSHKGSHSHGGQTRDGQRSGGGERRGNGQRPVRRQARPQG